MQEKPASAPPSYPDSPAEPPKSRNRFLLIGLIAGACILGCLCTGGAAYLLRKPLSSWIDTSLLFIPPSSTPEASPSAVASPTLIMPTEVTPTELFSIPTTTLPSESTAALVPTLDPLEAAYVNTLLSVKTSELQNNKVMRAQIASARSNPQMASDQTWRDTLTQAVSASKVNVGLVRQLQAPPRFAQVQASVLVLAQQVENQDTDLDEFLSDGNQQHLLDALNEMKLASSTMKGIGGELRGLGVLK